MDISSVLSTGILVADIIGKPVDRLPKEGRLRFLEKVEFHSGGCATNPAVDLTKLGLDAEVIGVVGDDPLGDFLIEDLRRWNVRTERIRRGSLNTSATMVMVSKNGERSFFHSIGANRELTSEDIQREALENHDLIHIGGSFLMPGFDGEDTYEVLKRAKEKGMATSLDTALNVEEMNLAHLKPSLSYLDYFLPSIEEAKLLCDFHQPERIADFFLRQGVTAVGLKMGENGCYVKDGSGKKVNLESLDVQVEDTTGAGDAFVAGFIAGLSQGLNLIDCARLATVVASFCVRSIGATAGVPNLEEALVEAGSRYPKFRGEDSLAPDDYQ